MIRVRLIVVMFAGLLAAVIVSPVVHAATYTYDGATLARGEVVIAPTAGGALSQASAPAAGPVERSWPALGGSTTPSAAAVATEDGERTYDWRKLGNREFENFFGESAEDVKKDIVGSGGSKFDLYEDKCTGEIFVLRKSGVGEPQPTGYRFPK
jgi:hypothetical protein